MGLWTVADRRRGHYGPNVLSLISRDMLIFGNLRTAGCLTGKTPPANCSPSAVSMISPSRPVLGSVMRVTVSSSQIWPGRAVCECRGHLDELLRGLLSRSRERQG
jgi:hypothetical protein